MAERAWALAVVSSAPQELSIDEQERWAHETAGANGWDLARTFRGVSSGRHGTRKLLDELLDDLQAMPKPQRPRRLLMVRLDRLGRGTGIETMAAIAQLRKLGVSIYTRDIGDVTIEKASDTFRPMLDAITAALENEKRSDRARAGKARRRAAGLHNGNPPYGCTLLDGRAVAYEPEAVLARDLFEKRASGWGYDRLARLAAQRAVPKLLGNGKTRSLRWGRSTVQRLLWCRTLRGVVIEPALWDSANAITNPDFKTRKVTSWPYPLTGALRCMPPCSTMLSGQCSGRRSSRGRYYVCRNVAEHGYYPHHRARNVEAAFQVLLERLASKPELIAPSEAGDIETLRVKEREVAKAAREIEARREQIWSKSDFLSGPQLRERLDEIDADRAGVQQQLAEIRAEIDAAQSICSAVEALSQRLVALAEEWQHAPVDQQQEAARAVAAVVGGIYIAPAPKTAPHLRKRGQSTPTVLLTGVELEYVAVAHLSEHVRRLSAYRSLLGIRAHIN